MYFPKNVNTSAMTNCEEMFRESAIEDLDISVPAVTTMFNMCWMNAQGGNNLRSVNLRDVGNTITTMEGAFRGCYDLASFTTSKPLGEISSLTNVGHLFYACHLLKSLDISLPVGATASITNADNVVRECLGMETFTFIQPKCANVSGWRLGANTTNGCLCNVQYGSNATSDVWGEFRSSKIAAGSVFIIENIPSSKTLEMFKPDNGASSSTIYENANSNITLTPKTGNTINASNMFASVIFPNGCNHITITGIGNCYNMFGDTQFPGSNKTIDLTNCTWTNCTNFIRMFNNSQVQTILGFEDISLSSTTSLADIFNYCSNLTTVVIGDTSTITNFQAMFGHCPAITTIPTIDTSNGTNLAYMFSDCTSLVTAPTLNTGKAENVTEMFCRNYVLENVPVYTASKVTNFSNMFLGCKALTDQSLDNILQMCISATSYAGQKSLAQLGFKKVIDNVEVYPVSRWMDLPHYTAFTQQNWIIGYN